MKAGCCSSWSWESDWLKSNWFDEQWTTISEGDSDGDGDGDWAGDGAVMGGEGGNLVIPGDADLTDR